MLEVEDDVDREQEPPAALRLVGGGSARANDWLTSVDGASRKQKRQFQ